MSSYLIDYSVNVFKVASTILDPVRCCPFGQLRKLYDGACCSGVAAILGHTSLHVSSKVTEQYKQILASRECLVLTIFTLLSNLLKAWAVSLRERIGMLPFQFRGPQHLSLDGINKFSRVFNQATDLSSRQHLSLFCCLCHLLYKFCCSPSVVPSINERAFADSVNLNYFAVTRSPAAASYVAMNTVSVSHFLKDSLSLNCLNSSVSSFIRLTMTRASALSCSIRAFWRSEFFLAFW